MKLRRLLTFVAMVATSATVPVVIGVPHADAQGADPSTADVTTQDFLGVITEYPAPTAGPGSLAVGPDDKIWYLDEAANQVVKYTLAGSGTAYDVPTANAHLFDITAGPDGRLWFTEGTTNKIGAVTTTGTFTEYELPTGNAQARGITVGSDGNLWFTEVAANQIGKITTTGTVTEYPIPTGGSQPVDIVLGSDGNLWFTEITGLQIGRITTSGTVTEFPLPTHDSDHVPEFITSGGDGNLWFNESGSALIGRITPAGVITEFPTPADTVPGRLTQGPDGNVWFTAGGDPFGHSKIGRVTADGTITGYPIPTLYAGPSDVVTGPDGNVWFGEANKMGKVGTTPNPTGEFTSLTPARLLDTRPGFTTIDGQAQGIGAVGENASIDVQISGRGGVPAAGQVSAVVLNATVAGPTASSFLTVWPTGVTRPFISNLNYVPGQVVPNLVTVALGTGGKVSVYNHFGNAHVIFDVVGYYSTDTGPFGSRFHGVTPFRFFDTRNGTGGIPAQKVGQGGVLKFKVTGKGGVPSSGVTAVVMNVTVTEPDTGSFLTVYPDDVSRPNASSLNYVPGLTVPNLVEVRVPASGVVDFYNHNGSTHVLADVVGYYDGDKSTEGGRFVALTPFRRFDSRVSSPIPGAKIPGGAALLLRYPTFPGLPAAGIGSMVTNVTVTEPDSPSFVTVFPTDAPLPLASNLNFVPNQTVPNLVIVKVSNGPTPNGGPSTLGWIGYFNNFGKTHLVVDVFGYFTASFTDVNGLEVETGGPDAGVMSIG